MTQFCLLKQLLFVYHKVQHSIFRMALDLSASKFARLLSLAGSALFVPAQHLTLHGLRRGVAQACAEAGLSIEELHEAGSWKGETYQT